MRIGKNPLKESKSIAAYPNSISVGVLNFIPQLGGYYSGQLDSLKLCLASLGANSELPFELLVVDNGSCIEVTEYLTCALRTGRIDSLILNRRNLGKMNAQMQLLHAASGDLVFYSDGDIFYRPGWMEAHLDVLKAFPEAGLVGGIPLHNLADFHTARTRAWVDEHQSELVLEKGNLIPENWTRDFFHSIGTKYNEEDWALCQDWRVVRGECTAFVGASHMQFLTSRKAIDAIPRRRFQFALEPSETAHLDNCIEEAGFLRLSVPQPVVYHIGNAITEIWLDQEFRRLVQTPLSGKPGDPSTEKTLPRHWFWGRSKVRQFLRWLSDWAFKTAWEHARLSPPR